MTYSKTNWADYASPALSAANLNKIEQGVADGSPVDNISTLKGLAVGSLSAGEMRNVLGYYAAGDGGGGTWIYDSTSTATDDGGTIIAPTGGTGRWLLIIEDGQINLRQFGAKGDNSTDDTAKIQAAINACLYTADPRDMRAKYKLFVPGGRYKVTSSIDLTARGLIVEGVGFGDEHKGTIFVWYGNSTTPMFDTHMGDCQFRDFKVSLEQPLLCGFRLGNKPAKNTYWIPTKNDFTKVSFHHPAVGANYQFTNNIEITGATAKGSQDANNEYHTFERCQMSHYTNAALLMEDCGSSHMITLRSCDIIGLYGGGDYAVRQIGSAGGYFLIYDCGGGYHQVADFSLNAPSHHVLIQGWNSENSYRLLETVNQGQNGNWRVSVRSCRFEGNGSYFAPDGYYINFGHNGPLIVDGNHIGLYDTNPVAKVRLNSYGGSPVSGGFIHTGNHYQHVNTLPDTPIVVASGSWRILDEGNTAINLTEGLVRPTKSASNVGGSARFSADRGNASVTLGLHEETVQRFETTLTANRTVTLPSAHVPGIRFRIVRSATTPGAFTLTVQTATPTTIKALPASTNGFIEVASDGTAWRLVGYGTF